MISFWIIVAVIVFVLGIIIAYNWGYDKGYHEAYYGNDFHLPPITGFDAQSHALDKLSFEEEVELRMREMALESERVPVRDDNRILIECGTRKIELSRSEKGMADSIRRHERRPA